jgi:hypothetical protein
MRLEEFPPAMEGEGTHGAGADDHAIGEAGAAGDGAGVISGAILNECSGVVCGTGLGFEWAKVPVATRILRR